MSPFRRDVHIHTHPIRKGKGRQLFLSRKKIDEGIVYLPKIFSCLSITVLYNSVSLNHDFSSREEKIFTATFSPCQLPLHTSPYLPFPVENSRGDAGRRTGQVSS